ncbi:MAG TPA: LysR substrate-binding domain-containing protein [Streptosporangiaceae bacterium]
MTGCSAPRPRSPSARSDPPRPARAGAGAPARIVIGYTTGLIVTPAVRRLRRQHPDAEAQTQYLEWNEPRAALLDHRVDAAVTRLPLHTSGLQVTTLYDEPRSPNAPGNALPARSPPLFRPDKYLVKAGRRAPERNGVKTVAMMPQADAVVNRT